MQAGSISRWIENLKDDEADAAQMLWDRYSERLIVLARASLGNVPRQVADEEDVAISVFASICRAASEGRLKNLKSRDELWWLLIRLTQRKVSDYVRHETAQKRGGGHAVPQELSANSNASGASPIEELISREPTPEFLAMLQEQQQWLMGLLRNDELRAISLARIEGYEVEEIASKLKLSSRSIERKLRLIRDTWAAELGQ